MRNLGPVSWAGAHATLVGVMVYFADLFGIVDFSKFTAAGAFGIMFAWGVVSLLHAIDWAVRRVSK